MSLILRLLHYSVTISKDNLLSTGLFATTLELDKSIIKIDFTVPFITPDKKVHQI